MDLIENLSIKDLYRLHEEGKLSEYDQKEVTLGGFVKANRTFGDVGFLAINDGSTFLNAQIVYKSSDNDCLIYTSPSPRDI